MAPASLPLMYTGEPEKPAAMPVEATAEPDTWTATKSTPGAIPSGRTPRIFTLKDDGVVPLTTVYPVPVIPAFRLDSGKTGGGVPHAVVADAVPAPPVSPAAATAATPSRPVAPAQVRLRIFAPCLLLAPARRRVRLHLQRTGEAGGREAPAQPEGRRATQRPHGAAGSMAAAAAAILHRSPSTNGRSPRSWVWYQVRSSDDLSHSRPGTYSATLPSSMAGTVT